MISLTEKGYSTFRLVSTGRSIARSANELPSNPTHAARNTCQSTPRERLIGQWKLDTSSPSRKDEVPRRPEFHLCVVLVNVNRILQGMIPERSDRAYLRCYWTRTLHVKTHKRQYQQDHRRYSCSPTYLPSNQELTTESPLTS